MNPPNASIVQPSEETPRQRSVRIGRAKGRYDRIRVDYPPATDAIEEIDAIRAAGLELPAGAPRGGGFLVAPIGCGKTEVLKGAEALINEDAPPERRPALRIEISVRGTTDSVPQAILAALGVKRPSAGSEPTQWDRAIELMQRQGTEILLIDEFNRAARRPTFSAAIAIGIQERVMDSGVCPVIFAGSERAATVLGGAPSVLQRLDDQIDLPPLDWRRPGDDALIRDFLRDLDAAIAANGLLPARSKLSRGDVPELLCRASAGKLRAIVKTVRVALGLALHRDAPAMDREDLAEAVDRYCLRQKLIRRNPFLDAEAGGQPDGSDSDGTPDDAT